MHHAPCHVQHGDGIILALRPLRFWTDELTAPATSVSRQSVDVDKRRFRMSAAGFLLDDTPVLCHAHNDTPEHTTGTGFAPVRVTSAVPGAVELCVPMSDAMLVSFIIVMLRVAHFITDFYRDG